MRQPGDGGRGGGLLRVRARRGCAGTVLGRRFRFPEAMPASAPQSRRTDAVLRDVVRLYAEARRATTACCGGATARESEALLLLGRQEGLTVQAFAEQMGLEKTWASRLLVRLEEAGLVRRADNPADGRSLLIELTAKGRAGQRKLAAGAEAQAVNLLDCVPAAERANVERALGLLRDALAACVADCGPKRRKG